MKLKKSAEIFRRILPIAFTSTLGLSTAFLAAEEVSIGKANNSGLENKISSIEQRLFKVAQPISTQNILGMGNIRARQIGVDLPHAKIELLFTDIPSTPINPDYCLTISYAKKPILISSEEFLDVGLNGLESDNPIPNPEFSIISDEYNIRNHEGMIENKLPSLSRKEIREINSRLFRYLTQIEVYTRNQSGILESIKPNDLGIQYPKEVPVAGILGWEEPLPGFEVSSLDVIFQNRLYDRIQLIKIDPREYKFSVYNDPNLRTVEKWREDLDALAVINTSFYHSDPYGFPLTPIISQGTIKGPKLWKTLDKRCAAFLAEPKDKSEQIVKIIEFENNSIVDMGKLDYFEGILNYPSLLQPDNHDVAPHLLLPQRRANRTFIGLDKEGRVILGTTENGFFDLGRLGRFLDSVTDLNLEYALNMDGGPPACMAIEAGNFKYTHYGSWEVNEQSGSKTGSFQYGWTNKNASKWEIPNVVAVTTR